MWTRILLFLLGNILFISLVIAIYGFGYEYDKAYKLSPEQKQISYDLSLTVYGERWTRIAKLMLVLGGITDAAILMIWYRKNQKESQNRTLS
ncbi:MAG: hypothetical protein WKF34_13510 [Pyrinomonadaceae bacterium]